MRIMNARSTALILLVLAAAAVGCLAVPRFDESAWRRQVAATDPADLHAPHRRADGSFFNPWLPDDKSWWDFWRWRLSINSLGQVADQEFPTPTVANDGAYLADPDAPASVTWVGHATFAVQWGGQVVVTDPFFSHRAAIVPRKVPPAFGVEAVPQGAVVIVSHNHYDHLDSESIEALAGKAAVFLCPLGLGDCLRGMGARRVREMDWWDSHEHGGTTFTAVPVQHWSRRLGQGRNQSLWAAFVLQRGGKTVFYGADSGYFKGFKAYGRRWPDMDLALLPLGAYRPRWFMHYAHMNPAEVLEAFQDLGAERMVPTQWGVMPLGDEPPAWPRVDLLRALDKRPRLAAKVEILPVGGRLLLD
jgi:L-ascorbate metabolism protein UlaG (beta-lactamase superfamily)